MVSVNYDDFIDQLVKNLEDGWSFDYAFSLAGLNPTNIKRNYPELFNDPRMQELRKLYGEMYKKKTRKKRKFIDD